MFTWETEPTIHRYARGETTVPIPGPKPAKAEVASKARDATEIARMREPSAGRETRLSSVTHAWVTSFQSQERPFELCLQYPRVANRIALCWPDPTLARHIFESLLVDKRGGRRGFPPEVQAELIALRHASEQAALQAARDLPAQSMNIRRCAPREDRRAAQTNE